MIFNNIFFTLVHFGMIACGLGAIVSYRASPCKGGAYGKSVISMGFLLLIFAPIMLIVHTCFFISYVRNGYVSCFGETTQPGK